MEDQITAIKFAEWIRINQYVPYVVSGWFSINHNRFYSDKQLWIEYTKSLTV